MVRVKYIHAEGEGFEAFQEQTTSSIFIIKHFFVSQDEHSPLCLLQNASSYIEDLHEKAERNTPA